MRLIIVSCLVLTGLYGLSGTARAQHGVRGGADSVEVVATVEPSNVTPGAVVTIAVTFKHAQGFHTWPNEPVVPPAYEGVNAIATSIEVVSVPEGAEVNEIHWPEPVPVTVRYTHRRVELLSYVGETTARLLLGLSPNQSAGTAEVWLRVRFQACDERVCYPPKTEELNVSFQVGPG